jgi:folylpolyglutamate synthase/dihydropteroate synthase
MLTRRDALAMLRQLAPVAERILLVPIPGFDAFPPPEIAARAAEAGIPAEPAASVAEALARTPSSPACVTGTLYLYGETRRALVPSPSGSSDGQAIGRRRARRAPSPGTRRAGRG